MKKISGFLIFLLFLLFLFHQSSVFSKDKDIEIGGLIVNKTVTAIGQNFFHAFSASWEWPSESENLPIIIISEKADARYSLIEVKISDFEEQVVYKKPLGRRSDSKQEAAIAIKAAMNYLGYQNEQGE